ncbi:hypothetical protein [Staphylococcus phage LY01]|nr:hypothetical protein [Staphylococcus phage LY01]
MYKEPRQAKVVYINVVTNDRNEIIKLESKTKNVYLNSKMHLSLKFNDLDFDTNDLRIFEKEILTNKTKNPMSYKEFKEKLLVDDFYFPLVDTKLTITDSNYEHEIEINIYKI